MSFWKRSLSAVAGVSAIAVISAGCFLADDSSRDDADFERVREGLDEAADGLGEAAEGLREALGEMAEELSAGGVVERPISFRDLYEFLPERIGDFSRRSREGKTEGAMGFDVSAVEAEYENEDGGRIEIAIVDLGALPMVAAMGFADWMDYEVDEENDRGWERTLEYDGFPAHEEFRRTDGDRGRADFRFLVENRFVVNLEGRNVTMDELHDIRDEIDADELAEMKDREGEPRERDRRGRRDRDR